MCASRARVIFIIRAARYRRKVHEQAARVNSRGNERERDSGPFRDAVAKREVIIIAGCLARTSRNLIPLRPIIRSRVMYLFLLLLLLLIIRP